MKHTKLAYLIQDAGAFDEMCMLTSICKSQKLYIIIDETTDSAITQVLADVRYFYLIKQDVADALLDSIVVQDRTAAGYTIQ